MRNWMKTTSLAFVFVAVFAATLLVGGFTPTFAQSDEEVTLTVLNYHDNTAATARREQTEIWDRFAELCPNIRIQREDLFLEPFHQKVEAYAAADQVPDVVYMWPGGRSTTLHRNHLVKDIMPLLGDKAAEFSPAALVPQAGGYMGMLPIGLTGTHVMFVNHGLLDELGLSMPETYEDLVAMVPVVRAARKELIVIGAEDDWVMQSVLFSMIAGRIAGDDFFDAVAAGEAKFTDAPFVDALRFFRQMFDDGVLNVTSLLTPYGEAASLFATERAPFLIDGDWRTGDFLTNVDTGEALIPVDEQPNYALTVFPAIPGEVNARTTSSVVGVGAGWRTRNSDLPPARSSTRC